MLTRAGRRVQIDRLLKAVIGFEKATSPEEREKAMECLQGMVDNALLAAVNRGDDAVAWVASLANIGLSYLREELEKRDKAETN